MADLLKRELNLESRLVEGDTGEFTIWVDNRMVAKKGFLTFPSDRKVLAAVKAALT